MNIVNIVGRITAQPELRTTPSGKNVLNFTIAEGKEERATFIDAVAWDKTAELIEKYINKGEQLGITGRLQTRSYEDKEGNKRKSTEVVVNEITFISNNSTPKQGNDVIVQDIEDKPVDIVIPF